MATFSLPLVAAISAKSFSYALLSGQGLVLSELGVVVELFCFSVESLRSISQFSLMLEAGNGVAFPDGFDVFLRLISFLTQLYSSTCSGIVQTEMKKIIFLV